MILEKIQKLANKLDSEGYFEAANELTDILEAAAVEAIVRKTAAATEIRIPVEEKTEQNEWLASFNLWQNNQLRIGNLEQVSSPIYQTEELRQAGNKQPGIEAMKQQLRTHIRDFRRRHPEYAAAGFVIENPLFR